MESSSTTSVVHSPQVGRDVHARLAGTRPNQDAESMPFWGDDGFTFGDLVDLLNPLHHIPIVGSLYRGITGDEIAPGPRIFGGAVFAGGPVGAAIAVTSGAINAGLEQETGKDVGAHVLSWVGFDPAADPGPAPKMVAEVTGMPWLVQETAQKTAPATTPTPTQAPTQAPMQVAAITVTAKPTPRRAVTEPIQVAQPAASTRMTPPLQAAQDIQAARYDRAGGLTEDQWAMLVASVDQNASAAKHRSALPDVNRSAPPGLLAGATIENKQIQPADLAATMAQALDRYEAISRNRGLNDLTK